VHEYDPGTWGPSEADALIAGIGHWDNPSASAI
jgi:glucose-6-phosphate 1-dehydrogenase